MKKYSNNVGAWPNGDEGSDKDKKNNKAPLEGVRLNRAGDLLRKKLITFHGAMTALASSRRTMRKQAEKIGRLLLAVRDRIAHGNWLDWLRDNTTIDGVQLISDKVARNWMSIARNRAWLNSQFDDLNISDSLALISQRGKLNNLPDAHVASTAATSKTSSADQSASSSEQQKSDGAHWKMILSQGYSIIEESITKLPGKELAAMHRKVSALLRAIESRLNTYGLGGAK
jgi:hypothetical protein